MGTSCYNDAVYLPTAVDAIFPTWQPIPNLTAYLQAMFATMMNYLDNTQSMLPGYRERIIHIRLDGARGEGGLNLNMSPETIAAIDRKGRAAGALLNSNFNFEHHRWVRFRVLMARLEEQLSATREALTHLEPPPTARQKVSTQTTSSARSITTSPYRELTSARVQMDYPFPAFTHDELQWREHAIKRIDALCALLDAWSDQKFLSEKFPTPPSVLRVTPNR